MARIEFRNVVKRFGDVEVLPDMNLTIEDGEFVALLGPSGCGKSTSLFLLAGIYLPSGGDILFDGHVVNEVEARDRNVGIVFQSYALYPHMSVRDNILFPLRFKKTPREEALRRVKAAADLVHVGELLDRKPSELSGGQQQRVALGARAGEGASAPPPRRAALQSRRDASPDHAHRDQVAAGEARRDDGSGHARSDRSDDHGRPHHLHARRPDRAGRHAGRSLSPARTASSSRASSAPRRST